MFRVADMPVGDTVAPLSGFACKEDDNPYSDERVRLARGELPDGSIVHVLNVVSGLACNCVCPACGAKLIARKPRQRAAHFAHYAGSECAHAPETALHKFAKQVLEKHCRLLIPPIEYEEATEQLTLHQGGEFSFDSVRLEARIGEIIPDVMVRKGSRDLLVEIFVTHRCSEKKIAEIRKLGISALEIDLSPYPHNATDAVVEAAIIKAAEREWLYNPRLDECVARVRQKLADSRAVIAKREAHRLEKLIAAAKEAKTTQARRAPQPKSAAVIRVEREGFVRAIDQPIAGDYCFSSTRHNWQAAILEEFVCGPLDRGNGGLYRLNASNIMKWVREKHMLHPKLPYFIDDEDEHAIQAEVSDFQSSYSVVITYMNVLCHAEILRPVYNGWRISDKVAAKWDQRLKEQIRKRDQKASVFERLGRIVSQIPSTERAAFSEDRWYRTPLPEFSLSFEAAIEKNSRHFGSMIAALGRIESMLSRWGTTIADNLLELPLEKERERIVEHYRQEEEARQLAREERLQQEAAQRVAEIETHAKYCLGADGSAWIAELRHEFEGRSARDLAQADAGGLRVARVALDREHRKREIVQERERLAFHCQQELQVAAVRKLAPERANLFLNTGQYALHGEHPIRYCVDKPTLEKCMSLLTAATKR